MATAPRYDWYLREWLGTLHQSVAWLESETGWTHRIANQLVNRKVRWNRDHLSLAATVLKIAPHELLMHPDDAMHIRELRAREVGLRLASDADKKTKAKPVAPKGISKQATG